MKGKFALARELFMEQRYYSHRSQNNNEGISKDEVHALRNKFSLSLLTNYFIYAFFFLMLSLILIIDNSARIKYEFYIILIPLYLYVLAFSSYTTLSFLEYIKNSNSVRLLGILPVRNQNLLLFLSWFTYSGSLGIFLLVPATFIYVSQGGNALEVPFQFVNAVTSIMLGYSLGSVISNIRLSSGSVKGRALRNVSRNAAIAILFLLFYAGISLLPNSDILFSNFYRNPLFIYIPFINFSYAFQININSAVQMLQIIQYLLYVVVAYLVLKFASTKGFRRIIEGSSTKRNSGIITKHSLDRKTWSGHFRPSLIKDSKLILRESLPSLLVFTPLFLIFPYDISLLSISYSKALITPFMVIFSATVSVISAACYSIAFMSVESGGIQYLHLLFPDQKRVLMLKMFSSIFIFSIIYIPMAISALYISGIPQLLWPGIIMSSVSLFAITLTLSLKTLLQGSTNVLKVRGISTFGTPAEIALKLSPGPTLSIIITILSVYISLLLSHSSELMVGIWSFTSFSALMVIILKYCIPVKNLTGIRSDYSLH